MHGPGQFLPHLLFLAGAAQGGPGQLLAVGHHGTEQDEANMPVVSGVAM